MPMRPFGFSVSARCRSSRMRLGFVFDLLIHVDDQHGVERALRQIRVRGRAKPRDHVLQPFAADTPFDGFEHRLLNVFGIDKAVFAGRRAGRAAR